MDIKWKESSKEVFNKVIDNLPQFHRSIAKQLVKEKAEELAQGRNSEFVEDKDMVVAFFQEVPPAFKDMMKRLFSQLNIDYSQYINE
jgi:2-hydroxy-3-keto-5-methylthiopentenyl-1-phosphate phosphatase